MHAAIPAGQPHDGGAAFVQLFHFERGQNTGFATFVGSDTGRRARIPLRPFMGHPGPAVVDVVTARQDLALPPKISFQQAGGFTLWATRSVLSGDGSAVLEVARTNLRQLAIE